MRDTSSAPDLTALTGPRLARALERVDIEREVLARLATPERVSRVTLRLRRDDGQLALLPSWRVQYCSAPGPMKGGVRFHAEVGEAELSALGLRILLKCAVNGLPHGGAAGGVAVAARELSRRELEAVSRAYVEAHFDVLGPERDILSPDLYTDATVMAWMSDEYNRLARRSAPAAVNGKAVGRGGVPGRHAATGRGAATVLTEVLAESKLSAAGMTVAIQGFGAAGSTLARELHRRGARVVAVCDSTIAIHDPKGLDVEALVTAREAGRRLIDTAPAVGRMAPDALLELDVDILAPAARADQVHDGNVDRTRCKFLLEIANGPVAPSAEERLVARGTRIVPDVLANAGGITVSHFEWVQGRTGEASSEADVERRLDARLTEATHAILTLAREHQVSMAVAAQIRALLSLRKQLAV